MYFKLLVQNAIIMCTIFTVQLRAVVEDAGAPAIHCLCGVACCHRRVCASWLRVCTALQEAGVQRRLLGPRLAHL